jgi:hypothetical protein
VARRDVEIAGAADEEGIGAALHGEGQQASRGALRQRTREPFVEAIAHRPYERRGPDPLVVCRAPQRLAMPLSERLERNPLANERGQFQWLRRYSARASNETVAQAARQAVISVRPGAVAAAIRCSLH